jgi:hypothetical protein
MLRNFIFLFFLICFSNLFAQVGIGTTSPASSAILELSSTSKGFLPPRMTTSEVNSISSPAEGLVVYSTTENQLCLYNGTMWRKLNDSPL